MRCESVQKNGVFILSLDCEGKWGVADCITEHYEKCLTTENKKKAYHRILSILRGHDIAATFAFVTALTLSQKEFKKNRDIFFEVPESYRPWLSKFYKDVEQNNYEGWFCPEVFEMVAKEDTHEIASHGCFHLPMSEKELSEKDADYSFVAAKKLASGQRPKTFVYPRNQVGFVSLLEKHGYVGYRAGIEQKRGPIKNIKGIVSEYNVLQGAQKNQARIVHNTAEIPSGYFLNWPSGVRKYVPASVTYRRWERILEDAVENQKIAHMWFHPHNFTDGPGMADNFEKIIRKVAEYRDKRGLRVMTMKEYCDALRPLKA
jgi:peptidoglycan/xylan/chitin deacetylase (PgdA/CDA1 family)